MAKKIKKSVKKEDKEEVCEVFDVGKGKSEKEISSCKIIPKRHATEEEKKEHEGILKIVVISIIGILLVTMGTWYFIESQKSFNYVGLKFKILQEGDVTFYHTTIPWFNGTQYMGTYKVYLRKDPRIVAQTVLMDEKISWRSIVVLNSSERKASCQGDEIISIANLDQIIRTGIGLDIGRYANASCDEQGRYTFLNIQEGNTTQIVKYGPSCYTLEYAKCEILDVTERLIVKALAEYNINAQVRVKALNVK